MRGDEIPQIGRRLALLNILVAYRYARRIGFQRNPCAVNGRGEQGQDNRAGNPDRHRAEDQPPPMLHDPKEGREVEDIRGGIDALARQPLGGRSGRVWLDRPGPLIRNGDAVVHAALYPKENPRTISMA